MTRKSRPSAKPNHHTRSDSSNSLLKKNAASLDQKRALPSASSFRSTSLFICIAVWEETKKAPCIAHRQYNATQTAGCCSHCRSQVSLDMKHLETDPPSLPKPQTLKCQGPGNKAYYSHSIETSHNIPEQLGSSKSLQTARPRDRYLNPQRSPMQARPERVVGRAVLAVKRVVRLGMNGVASRMMQNIQNAKNRQESSCRMWKHATNTGNCEFYHLTRTNQTNTKHDQREPFSFSPKFHKSPRRMQTAPQVQHILRSEDCVP